MKKMIIILLAVMVICSSVSLAEDLSSFRDTVDAAGETAAVGGNIDCLAVVSEQGGRYYRAVTLLDDRAKELYMAAITDGAPDNAYEVFDAYAWSLPVCYTEELTVKPKQQAELDALAGKTIGELLAEGYSFYGIGGGENMPTTVDLLYGLFSYEFEVDVSFEKYQENGDWDGVEDMKVKSGKFSGFSALATNPDYLADGTYEPQFVPHITAEEAAAASRIPPAEEYTRNAWPLTTEGYSDLLDNLENRYGQVYMIEGVVQQVLSQNPARVVINTGEKGNYQPVVVECPEQLTCGAEAGGYYRIYADVSSSCYILPVLTARYIFTGLAPDTADESASDAEDPAASPTRGKP